jgi:hypothetical protein
VKVRRTPTHEGAHWGRSTLVCFSVGRTARTPSIVTGMREELLIRVRVEFEVERDRTRAWGFGLFQLL